MLIEKQEQIRKIDEKETANQKKKRKRSGEPITGGTGGGNESKNDGEETRRERAYCSIVRWV